MNIIVITYFLCRLITLMFAKADGGVGKMFIRDAVAENDLDVFPEEVPRVKIKVFRGPSEEQDGEKFATWGFWIKQPAKLDGEY